MNRCLILYSTTDGHTKKICDYIAHNLDKVNKISVVNITSFNQKDLDNYDSIIIGASIRSVSYTHLTLPTMRLV